MAEWKKVIVSGSNAELNSIFARGAITGSHISSSGNLFASLSINDNTSFKTVVYDPGTGKFFQTGSYGGGGGDSFFEEYITTAGSESLTTIDPSNLSITGASALLAAPSYIQGVATQSTNNYALVVSQSAYFYNHNVGYPTSNAWKSSLNGSYFNNFTANTDTSEILRFIAGLLSSSAPDASPNTFNLATFPAAATNSQLLARGANTIPEGNLPTGTTDSDALYTINKGFSVLGKKLFEEIGTIYTNPNYYRSYTSTRGGSSTVSSSTNSSLLGLGRISEPGVTIYFENTRSFDEDGTSFTTATATSSSLHIFSNSTLNSTAQGITLATIPTVNPAVIPPAFQDGYFTSIVPEPGLSSLFFNGNNINSKASTSISSSGWYRFTTTASFYSGSQTSIPFAVSRSVVDTIFFAPTASTFSTIRTELSTYGTLTYENDLITSSSFTSRSLSGVPYLNAASWSYSTTSSNAFRPLYQDIATITGEGLDVADFIEDSVNGADIGTSDFTQAGFTAATLNTTTGVINTAGVVFSASVDQNTLVPHRDSKIRYRRNLSLTTGALGTKTNMTRLTSTCADDSINSTFTTNIITSTGVTGTDTKTFTHRPHVAGAFGQPSSSGSLAIFLSRDGDDPSTNSSTTVNEKFLGEAYRRTIGASTNASDLENSFNSGSYFTNTTPYQCQVKPGFLVIPGSTYGYWYPASYYNTANYYWYLREINFAAGSSYGTLTITTATGSSAYPTLTALTDTSTSPSISMGILFRKGLNQFNGGGNTEITDLTKPGAATTGVTTGNSNPFSNNVNIKGFTGTAHSNTTGITSITLVDAANQTVDATHQKVWLLVRIRGEATSNILQNITFAVS